LGPNGPCAGRAGCFGQKSGRKWLFHVVRFGTLWHHGVASRAAREDELEPSVGLPCVCLPVDTCLRGSSDRRFDPHSGPMWTHSGLASECQLVELSARRIVELSHCRSVNVSKGCLRACVRACFLACCVHCTVASREGSISCQAETQTREKNLRSTHPLLRSPRVMSRSLEDLLRTRWRRIRRSNGNGQHALTSGVTMATTGCFIPR
jgi:hypothetical protein